MRQDNTILLELLKIFPRFEFDKLEKRCNGNYYTKYFTGWQQFITLLFAQAGSKDSLRDIETSLPVHYAKWYQIGLKGIKRSTLSDAMQNRPYEIFEGLFYKLLEKCQSVTPRHRFKFKNPLYTLDSTVIDLCLSIFPWATFRKRKGAIKLYYLYDHSGSLPTFMTMTDGKTHDMRVAKSSDKLDFALLPDSIISIDKAYIDYRWLYSLNNRQITFVTRVKSKMEYETTGQHKPIKNKAVFRDDLVRLTGYYSKQKYPAELRMVGYVDPVRWQIELFFKWIKQNLKIKSFLGSSPNAVLTQVWVAMCYYLLLTYIKNTRLNMVTP